MTCTVKPLTWFCVLEHLTMIDMLLCAQWVHDGFSAAFHHKYFSLHSFVFKGCSCLCCLIAEKLSRGNGRSFADLDLFLRPTRGVVPHTLPKIPSYVSPLSLPPPQEDLLMKFRYLHVNHWFQQSFHGRMCDRGNTLLWLPHAGWVSSLWLFSFFSVF